MSDYEIGVIYVGRVQDLFYETYWMAEIDLPASSGHAAIVAGVDYEDAEDYEDHPRLQAVAKAVEFFNANPLPGIRLANSVRLVSRKFNGEPEETE